MLFRFIALLLIVSCAPAPKPVVAPPPAPAPPAPEVKETELHAGVTALALDCSAGTAEVCNAVDDDCDGVVDEGCPYAADPQGVQISIAWNTGADIDLYVRDPSGEMVFYNEEARRSPVGGFLDQTARGACREEQAIANVESAHWPAPAPNGPYVVELHYFGPCGDSVETEVTMSVVVHGKLGGVYRYKLQPEERVQAVSFELR
jgi:tRNA (guanosine-2'-O-)-methyltransferase